MKRSAFVIAVVLLVLVSIAAKRRTVGAPGPAGVLSLNGLRGEVTLRAGENTAVNTASDGSITVSAAGAPGPRGPQGPQGPQGPPGPVKMLAGRVRYPGTTSGAGWTAAAASCHDSLVINFTNPAFREPTVVVTPENYLPQEVYISGRAPYSVTIEPRCAQFPGPPDTWVNFVAVAD